jgi:hypothetical protein
VHVKLALAVALSIVHVMQGCHVWSLSGSATQTVTMKRGGHVSVRISCPMDFTVVQTAGPRLILGDQPWHTGTSHTLVFAKKGVYRLDATNVQSPEDVGLQTMGPVNVLHLVVRVR